MGWVGMGWVGMSGDGRGWARVGGRNGRRLLKEDGLYWGLKMGSEQVMEAIRLRGRARGVVREKGRARGVVREKGSAGGVGQE